MHTDLFRKMQRVRQLFFRCQSGHGSRMDWNHHGSGHTTITVEGNDIYFDDAFVLDNRYPVVRSHSKVSNFKPSYSVNDFLRWNYWKLNK